MSSDRLTFGSERIPLKCSTKRCYISSYWVTLFPSFSFKEKILLCWWWFNMALWKNLEFVSPSFSHCMWDFCFRRISSYFRLSSNWVITLPSSFARTWLWPSQMIFCWILSILDWSFPCSWWMLPNSFLFHFLILLMISLSLSWNECIFLGPSFPLLLSYHQPFTLSRNSRAQSQKDSSQKGLFLF